MKGEASEGMSMTRDSDLDSDLIERTPLPDEVRKALGYIGSIRTAKKAASSRRNGQLYGGRPTLPLAEIPCTCGAGSEGEAVTHKSTCPRGRAIKRRLQKTGG